MPSCCVYEQIKGKSSFGQALLIRGLRDVGLGKLEIKFSAGREARLFVSVGERSQSRGGSPSSYTGMGRLSTRLARHWRGSAYLVRLGRLRAKTLPQFRSIFR